MCGILVSDMEQEFWHAYKAKGYASYATYAKADGTEVEISCVEKGELRDPLPSGWVYVGEVVHYVRGSCIISYEKLMMKDV